jgi:hypothetical protein
MTKRDFERLAKALVAAHKADAIHHPSRPALDRIASYELYVDQVALACDELSSGFKYAQFRAACGLGG